MSNDMIAQAEYVLHELHNGKYRPMMEFEMKLGIKKIDAIANCRRMRTELKKYKEDLNGSAY